jgi:protein-L-isoaspartate(D-aspartate) O-methyltransferase
MQNHAYDDSPLPIGGNQTISQPYIVALMTQYLKLQGKEKVLEVGTGSGYQTAILAELAKEVYSIERLPNLAEQARRVLSDLGYTNIKITVGDGTIGWEEFLPYDGIIITAAASEVPPPLINQLNENGRLIIPLGSGFAQTLILLEKSNYRINTTEICNCVFVPLIGKYGLKYNDK